MSKLRVDIWSDIACPWCYVGKRRPADLLLRALTQAWGELKRGLSRSGKGEACGPDGCA